MKYFLILLTVLNLLIACGGNLKASSGYRLETLFGYTCITNDVSLWCER